MTRQQQIKMRTLELMLASYKAKVAELEANLTLARTRAYACMCPRPRVVELKERTDIINFRMAADGGPSYNPGAF